MAITIDGTNLLFILETGVSSYDVGADFYSEWKEWMLLSNNMGFPPAFSVVGGETTKPGQTIPGYFFFRNDLGWRMRPAEEDAQLEILGNLYKTDQAADIWVPTLGNFSVIVNTEVSPQGVAFDSGGGGGGSTWTDDEKKQIRDALGIDGLKVTAVGGQLQLIKPKVDDAYDQALIAAQNTQR